MKTSYVENRCRDLTKCPTPKIHATQLGVGDTKMLDTVSDPTISPSLVEAEEIEISLKSVNS